MTLAMILAYLGAIVLANLLVAALGPAIAPLNAFLLIGLDLSVRDSLHERWRNDQLALRMGVLIGVGGILSWVVNRDAGQIALASTVAFVLASVADAGAFQFLATRSLVRIDGYPYWRARFSHLERVNGSNLAGSAVDSIMFPLVAGFGLAPVLVLGLFAAKVAGGFVWSLILAIPLRGRPA